MFRSGKATAYGPKGGEIPCRSEQARPLGRKGGEIPCRFSHDQDHSAQQRGEIPCSASQQPALTGPKGERYLAGAAVRSSAAGCLTPVLLLGQRSNMLFCPFPFSFSCHISDCMERPISTMRGKETLLHGEENLANQGGIPCPSGERCLGKGGRVMALPPI